MLQNINCPPRIRTHHSNLFCHSGVSPPSQSVCTQASFVFSPKYFFKGDVFYTSVEDSNRKTKKSMSRSRLYFVSFESTAADESSNLGRLGRNVFCLNTKKVHESFRHSFSLSISLSLSFSLPLSLSLSPSHAGTFLSTALLGSY